MCTVIQYYLGKGDAVPSRCIPPGAALSKFIRPCHKRIAVLIPRKWSVLAPLHSMTGETSALP